MKTWVGSAGIFFPECPSDKGLCQDSGKFAPGFSKHSERACSIPGYTDQCSIAILGCVPTRYWTQLRDTQPIFSNTCARYVSMPQTLQGKMCVADCSNPTA